MEVNANINPTKMLPFSKGPMITKEWMGFFKCTCNSKCKRLLIL